MHGIPIGDIGLDWYGNGNGTGYGYWHGYGYGMHVCMSACLNVWMEVCMHTYMPVCVYVCMHIHVYMYISHHIFTSSPETQNPEQLALGQIQCGQIRLMVFS